MKLTDWLLDLLYPTRCVFCHRLIEPGERMCAKCLRELPGTPNGAQVQSFPFVKRCLSPLYYVDDVRASLLRYKFQSAVGYAEVYGDFLAKCIDENEVSCDSITWVPLSRRRLRRRGYDQAKLLAEGLAAHMGVDCVRLLKKPRDNPPQSGIDKAEKRRANVAGRYVVCSPELVKGRDVLLVDDIVTTGATLSECARMLKQAGAKSVTAVTVARSKK